jgi:NAD(P)-dependent dehydrogenase (short-subunit alcohol dehydrogenase family)
MEIHFPSKNIPKARGFPRILIPMGLLDGKVALITGAKGGLGTFVTRAFLDAGARVIGMSRSIREEDFPHPAFSAIPAELTDPAAVRQSIDRAVAQYQRIDVLVHVAGGFAGGQSIAQTDDDTFEKMLDLNLRAGFLVMRAVVPYMRRQNGGRILAVASRQAVEPSPMTGAYNISKAALLALVRTLALENKDLGITANTVLPGTMDTPGNRAGGGDPSGWVDPAQVAAILVHLASDAASQISGAAIPIYGSQL